MNVHFNRLENAQTVEKIARIFSKNKPYYDLKPNPLFVLLVGSPGVGKTTKAKEFLKKELNVNYDDFYNISLDSLVERVKPYRNVTKKLHNTLKAKKGANHEFTNENFATLSGVYLPTIMSTESNFKLPATLNSITQKIIGTNNSANKKKTARQKKSDTGLKNLNDMRREGLIYGVMNGFNILYDTTLASTKDKLKNDIMPVLKMNPDIKYKVEIILVTASSDKNIKNDNNSATKEKKKMYAAISRIKSRLSKRHKEMLEEADPYLRAVSPTMVYQFIKDNDVGFKMAKENFKEGGSYFQENPDTIYTHDDFNFIKIENP